MGSPFFVVFVEGKLVFCGFVVTMPLARRSLDSRALARGDKMDGAVQRQRIATALRASQ